MLTGEFNTVIKTRVLLLSLGDIEEFWNTSILKQVILNWSSVYVLEQLFIPIEDTLRGFEST